MLPACLGVPSTPREGEALRRGVGWRAESVDRPAAPPARGEGAGGMVVGLAPSQPESEREGGPHTTGYSSELKESTRRISETVNFLSARMAYFLHKE